MKLFAPIFLICCLVLGGCGSDGKVSSITGKTTKKVTSVDNSKITFEDGSTQTFEADKSTIFVVLNAEHSKNGNTQLESADLSPEGKQRATKLAQVLSEVELGAVMSSAQLRTSLTVQPTATAKNLGTLNYNSNTRHKIFEFIFNYNPGKKFLLAGENNSIPLIISDLTSKEIGPNLMEDAHDKFFVLTGTAAGNCTIEEFSY